MDLVLKDVRILDSQSPFHDTIQNILIRNGIIDKIGKTNFRGDKIINGTDLSVSCGWFDMRANFNDPGLEYKEDIYTGAATASAGGFTGVAILPNTEPVIQSKGQIEYIKSKSRGLVSEVLPMAAVTLDVQGKDLTEMIDLHHAGAVCFTDGEQPIWNPDVLLKSLLYIQKFNGLLINRPEDRMLTQFGDMNEGLVSTGLGMKGMPALAEELMLKRDLDILKYTGGKIHFSTISSKGAVKIIRKAKKDGLNVTCDVSIHHLIYTENFLEDFDTNFKSNPPFRTESDKKALIRGLADGTIDAIVSSHQPQDEENKKLEFDKAAFGLSGLQTFFPNLLQIAEDIDLSLLLEKITSAPRAVLDLSKVHIDEKQPANLTLFSRNQEWFFDTSTNYSKSTNSPAFQTTLKGKVLGTINREKSYFDSIVD